MNMNLLCCIRFGLSNTLNQDVFEEIDDMYEAVLANIQLIIGTKTLTQESQDVQLVYEAYSYVCLPTFHPQVSFSRQCEHELTHIRNQTARSGHVRAYGRAR